MRRALASFLFLAAAALPGRATAAVNFPDAALEVVSYETLAGWAEDDHAEAFKTFLKSCERLKRIEAEDETPTIREALAATCRRALALGTPDRAAARAFFEAEFVPFKIAKLGEETGLLTGYYEPEVTGSRVETPLYWVPVYRRPDDLVHETGPRVGTFPNKGSVFRKSDDGLVPYHDRAAIMSGVLAGKKLEIAWLADPVDAFFAQIQGSLRVRFPDDSFVRLNYDAHNGYPYTPVGRILIEKGIVPREEMSMDRIREYIYANPVEGRELMRANRSFVFFREVEGLGPEDGAIGGQGVSLTPLRSIAVDRKLHVYGTPFFIDAELPLKDEADRSAFRRLMIAQDTGSAIIGPARADIFFGAGLVAGQVSGRVKHQGTFTILLPKGVDPLRTAEAAPEPKPRPAPEPPRKKRKRR